MLHDLNVLTHQAVERSQSIVFTRRELDVLACLIGGRPSKKIAILLSISPKTVEAHVYNIMEKLGCHSRDLILEEIEHTPLFIPLKKHYLSLLLETEFIDKLKKIAKISLSHTPNALIIFEDQGEKHTHSFLSRMEQDLRLAGINIVDPVGKNKIDYVICNTKIEYLVGRKSLSKHTLSEHIIITPRESIFLIQAEKGNKLHLIEQSDVHYIYYGHSLSEEYPFLIFEVLSYLLPTVPISKLISDFKGHWCLIANTISTEVNQINPFPQENLSHLFLKIRQYFGRYKIFLWMVGGLLLSFAVFKYYHSTPLIVSPYLSVRSDLELPTNNNILNRVVLLKEIDKKFNSLRNIQTVVLLGMGGTGKTILARQYLQKQDDALVWELNAETTESLKDSFASLGYSLAQNESEKRDTEQIKKIDDSTERTRQLMHFIKRKMRSFSPWILLFDNVENLQELRHFFPTDFHNWGVGRILITTVNQHITHSSYINPKNIITMPLLTDEEKFSFFNKIIDQKLISKDHVKRFLKVIPSFPLDVAIAAHYIKHARISYKKYLDQLLAGDASFENSQIIFLKETSGYTKTRYSIIASSLKRLIEKNPDCIVPLLLIGMIGANQIPKELIDCCNNQNVADQFIYHMIKHSLILHKNNGMSAGFLSVHRSTQQIILQYLMEVLGEQEIQKCASKIVEAIEYYSEIVISRLDSTEMQYLSGHLLTLLKHSKFLNSQTKGSVESQVGYLCYYLDDFFKAHLFLEKGLSNLSQYYGKKSNQRIAKTLAYLGIVFRKLGDTKKSLSFLKGSANLYMTKFPHDQLGLAWPLLHLGWTYIDENQYEKAQEVLEQSIAIYNKHYGSNHPYIAWGLAYLGDVYRMLGYVQKALDFYEKSLSFCKKLYGNHHCKTLEVSTYLGFLYKYSGQYDKSYRILKNLPKIYNEKFPKNHDKIGLSLVYLGDLYRVIGLHKKSANFLKQGWEHCLQYYGPQHIRTAWSMVYFAQLFLDEGKYIEAQKMLEQAVQIYAQHSYQNNKITAWVMRFLANTYKYLGEFEKSENLFEKSLIRFDRKDDNSFVEYGQILRDFGHMYFLKGDFKKAKILINKGMAILKQNKHPDVYTCLEYLADLYVEKSKINNQNKYIFLLQAHDYFKQAMSIARTILPANSVHLVRLKEKYCRLFPKPSLHF